MAEERGPVVTRPQVLGAASARSLLLTVLGEFVLPSDQPVWTATLIDVLADLGVSEKSARQAIMRTAGSGLIVSQQVGRQVNWSLTDEARRMLEEGSRRIFGFTSDQRDWDGRWLVLAVAPDNNTRPRREQLRKRLRWAGLGLINDSTWVTSHVHREPEIAAVLNGLDLSAAAWSFVARPGQLGDELSMVRGAWDVEALGARYDDFLARLSRISPRDERSAMVAQIRLVQEWRRFPRVDPGLPSELLPPNWSGARAATLFAERHATWSQRGLPAWRELAGHG